MAQFEPNVVVQIEASIPTTQAEPNILVTW
jgi:hypothetical protein